MSSPSPTGRRTAARDRAAALRAQQAREERRRRVLLAGAAVVVVVAVIVALVVVKLVSGGGSTSKGSASSSAAPAAVVSAVTGVPATAYDTVGPGTVKTPPTPAAGQPLSANGKPRVLYVGAEYCPYCAAERWAVVAALSRFGTWSNLGSTSSASDDVYPNTATLSFHGATYSSSVLSFTGVEQTDRQHQPLDTLAAADQQILQANDPSGGIPFVDLAGRYLISGASYDPSVLQGKTAEQIATALADPTTPISKAVLGTANVITAALCQSTNQQPTAVCTSSGVTKAAAALKSGQQ